MNTFLIKSIHGDYPMYSGRYAYDAWMKNIPRTTRRAPLILCTQRTIFTRYGGPVVAGLKKNGYRVTVHYLPQGERAKSMYEAARVYVLLMKLRADRSTPLVALGGGVVGDLTGYVASTYLRGLPWYFLPTSVISQVDSSIGGKVGINFRGAKNQIGAWHPPKAVVANPEWLATEPERSYRSGLAEIIKIMLVSGVVSPDHLAHDAPTLLARRQDVLSTYVTEAARLKAFVVEEDEHETTGWRRILNYGHTIGHAVESSSKFGLTHGQCVAIGMMAAAKLGALIGCTPSQVVQGHADVFQAFGLPVICPSRLRRAAQGFLVFDKKRSNGSLKWVLLQDFGRPCIVSGISSDLIRRVLTA